MNKRFKRLKNKKGVTLVELIVVMAISAILFGIAMGIVQPVTALMNSIKANSNMDITTDIANEYIRNCMEKSVAVSAVSYHDLDALKATWKTYTDKFTKANGYSVRALGVMQNYNGDSRLYDFGEVNVIDHSWGAPGHVIHLQSAGENPPGTAFVTLIRDRDGGPDCGFGGNVFHKFDAFNDAFYSNGNEGSANYSFEVAFEVQDSEIDNGSSTVTGVSYITLYSQLFKRTGNWYSADPDEKVLKYEPANQARSISFNLLNGTAELDISQNVNTVETEADGTKTIKVATDAWGGRDGLVILYVVRDIDAVLGGAYIPNNPSLKPSFEISGGGIYGGFSGNWFGINDNKLSQTPLVIKNNSGQAIDTKDVIIEFKGDFTTEELSLSYDGNVVVSGAGAVNSIASWEGLRTEQKDNVFRRYLSKVAYNDETKEYYQKGLIWKDGETLTIEKMEIKGNNIGTYDPILTSSGKITIYVQGKVVWSKTVKKSG